ncbi:MAG TPA: polysaccharide deacetylase family protein [Methylomirabilota bacterium]|jgi:peptidoglycan/xylan/chitin deacetylase (PgdA/CDA1 family)|nr:polysaccharide deacetylase family protein [Methylomirabilota bacterium]
MNKKPARGRPGPGVRPPITWPRGVQAALCLTFDLDAETAWISRDPENLHRLAVMSQGAYGPKVGVPLLLDFLDRHALRATFFVPGWTAERYPDVVAEVHRRGHEIGHHGYLHEPLEGRSRDEEEEILRRGVQILEGITGERPVGYRAPRYEITRETIGLLRTHGFRYASNLQDTLWPYLHPGTPALVELPTTWIFDDGPYFAYGIRPPLYRQIYPPAAVLSTWTEELRGMHAVGGAVTLILHPQFIGRPSRVVMLEALVEYARTLPGVWLTHGRELAGWVASDAAQAGTDGRPRPGPDREASPGPARRRAGPALRAAARPGTAGRARGRVLGAAARRGTAGGAGDRTPGPGARRGTVAGGADRDPGAAAWPDTAGRQAHGIAGPASGRATGGRAPASSDTSSRRRSRRS